MAKGDEYLDVYWNILGYSGFLTPPHIKPKWHKWHRLYCWITFGCFSYVPVTMFINLVLQGYDNLVNRLSGLAYLISGTITIIKFVPFVFRHKEIVQILLNIKLIYNRTAEEGNIEKLKILSNNNKVKRIHLLFYFYEGIHIFLLFFLFSYSFVTIDFEDYRFKYENLSSIYQRTDDMGLYLDMFNPFDLRNKLTFNLNFLVYALCIIKITNSNPVGNIYYWGVIMDINRQLKLLNYNLENIKILSEEKILSEGKAKLGVIPENVLHQEISHNIKEWVLFHHQILKNIYLLRSIMVPYLTVNWICLAFYICLYMYQTSMLEFDSQVILEWYGTLMDQFEPFIYCLIANNLIVLSGNISSSAFYSKWYDGGAVVQKQIAFIMHRAQKNEYIYGIFVGKISLVLYSNIIQTAYSYFTLLRTLKD